MCTQGTLFRIEGYQHMLLQQHPLCCLPMRQEPSPRKSRIHAESLFMSNTQGVLNMMKGHVPWSSNLSGERYAVHAATQLFTRRKEGTSTTNLGTAGRSKAGQASSEGVTLHRYLELQWQEGSRQDNISSDLCHKKCPLVSVWHQERLGTAWKTKQPISRGNVHITFHACMHRIQCDGVGGERENEATSPRRIQTANGGMETGGGKREGGGGRMEKGGGGLTWRRQGRYQQRYGPCQASLQRTDEQHKSGNTSYQLG